MCFGCEEQKKASGGDAKAVAVGILKNPPQEYAEKCPKQSWERVYAKCSE